MWPIEKAAIGHGAKAANHIATGTSGNAGLCNANLANDAARKRSPGDFEFLDLLGEGSYSMVQLAKEKDTGKKYAMKIVDKAFVCREGKAKYVHIEKVVYHKLKDSPSFVKLFYTFQDPERLYFALSYAENGELLHYIRKLGSFDLHCAQWYTGELVLALEYMHSHGIIHRDLKPENILLSRDMHVKVTDFGASKVVENPDGTPIDLTSDCKDALTRSSSFVGTAEYVAPELLKEKETSPSSDLWALGCIVYQLIAGRPPFKGSNEYLTLQNVVDASVKFPPNFPEVAKDIISQLLVTCPDKRLGSVHCGGFPLLKAHSFFEGIQWQTLLTDTPPQLRPYLPAMATGAAPLTSNENTGGDGVAAHTIQDEPQEECSDIEDQPTEPDPVSLAEERRIALEKQKANNHWAQFVRPDELILYTSTVTRRQGFFFKSRQLILTDAPRLLYISLDKMTIKGEIPWNIGLKAELKDTQVFFVHTPRKTFYFEDPGGRAATWAHHFSRAMAIFRQKLEETIASKKQSSHDAWS